MRRTLCTTAVAFAALASSACNVAPKYVRPAALPPAVFPAAFKELKGDDTWKAANPSDGQLRGKWWEIFKDQKLNELEEMVSISNQNVKNFEAQFRAARAAVETAHAAYYPSISSIPTVAETQSGSVTGRGSAPRPSRSPPVPRGKPMSGGESTRWSRARPTAPRPLLRTSKTPGSAHSQPSPRTTSLSALSIPNTTF